jgi:hypothetical protein
MRAPYINRCLDQLLRLTRTFKHSQQITKHLHASLPCVEQTKRAVCSQVMQANDTLVARGMCLGTVCTAECNKTPNPHWQMSKQKALLTATQCHQAHVAHREGVADARHTKALLRQIVITGCTVASRDITPGAYVAPQAAAGPLPTAPFPHQPKSSAGDPSGTPQLQGTMLARQQLRRIATKTPADTHVQTICCL